MKRSKALITKYDVDVVSNYLSDSTRFGTGQAVIDLEEYLVEHTEYLYAVVVSAGSVALDLTVLAHNIINKDEKEIRAFVPKNTYVASARCFLKNGITPDVYEDTMDDYNHIVDSSIDNYTIGLAMHYGGHRQTPMSVFNCCQFVIEDSAHALSTDIGKEKSPITDVVTLSFNSTKNVTGDMGGCILTDNLAIAEVCRNLRSYDMNKTPVPDYVMKYGSNYRLAGLNATLVLSQLKQLDFREQRYVNLRERYDETLKSYQNGTGSLEHATICEASDKATFPHIINLVLGKVVECPPIEIIKRLRKLGIYTNIYYPAVDDLLSSAKSSVKITDKITLPMDVCLQYGDIYGIFRTITEVIDEINKEITKEV